MRMNYQDVPINRLIAGEAINSRIAGREEGIKELAKNIDEVGLMFPLVVRAMNGSGKFEIIDGHRRFAALTLLEGKSDGSEHMVPVLVRDADDASAGELSLAANIMRLQLHPADQFAAFAKLAGQGLDENQIASHFGVTTQLIRQRMALGSLLPDILEAYRDDKINLDTAKVLSGASLERQAQVWKAAAKANGKGRFPHTYQINQLLDDKTISSRDSRVKVVGLKAYEAAGGRVERNLFEAQVKLLDPAILNDLFAAQFAVKREALEAEGWKWIENDDAMPKSWQYTFQKEKGKMTFADPDDAAKHAEYSKLIADADKSKEDEPDEYQAWQDNLEELEEAATYAFTDAQKAKSGVVIGKDGEFTYGVLLPKDVKPGKSQTAEKAKKEKAKAEQGGYSDALLSDLNCILTNAAKVKLATMPETALTYLLLSMFGSDKSPVGYTPGGAFRGIDAKVWNKGQLLKDAGLAVKGSFEDQVTHISKAFLKKPGKALELLAIFVADSLEKIDNKNPAIAHLGLDMAKAWRPDKEFFERLTSAQLVEALTEAKATNGANKSLHNFGLKKAELVAMAVKHIPKTDWLPKPLRFK